MSLKPLVLSADQPGSYTDLYELTMAAAFFEAGHVERTATFELFSRRLGSERSFLVAAGLEQALHFLTHLSFSSEAVEYLRRLPALAGVCDDFFGYLSSLRFTGDVWAVPEGTLVFENEPLLQVRAPIIEAQIAETFLINALSFPTSVATKAARVCRAARGKPVVDFGTRRAHGPQAGVLAARAAFIGGCVGTSNVWAGQELNIPLFGTMAHSFVQFFEKEQEAFRVFLKTFGDRTTLLVDTYDTLEAVRKLTKQGMTPAAIRLDSGDLRWLAGEARALLDAGGLDAVEIFASSDLNEHEIERLEASGTPIDGYGVGTHLVTSADAPSCDMVYKLVATGMGEQEEPRFKDSPGKTTYPFRKQIYRIFRNDTMEKDVLAAGFETGVAGEPLLEIQVQGGELSRDAEPLEEISRRAAQQLKALPAFHKSLYGSERYPVQYSDGLTESLSSLRAEKN